MRSKIIDHLIINSPYQEPLEHWHYDRETRTFERKQGRRDAGYLIASPDAQKFDDPGTFVPIDLPNQIRPWIKSWRADGYEGASSTTRALLQDWNQRKDFADKRFFFCQLEAIETLIWLMETTEGQQLSRIIPTDSGNFIRRCCKMATGTGKTIVMAMLIAWQILNKVADPKNTRYSKNILIVAPGITIKQRLQVLIPWSEKNYYEEFRIVPSHLMDRLRLGKVMIQNWQAMAWDTEEQIAKRKSVDKRGVKSDMAYSREVLGEMAKAKNILVINDEAHHAWRVPANHTKKTSAGQRQDQDSEANMMTAKELKQNMQEATVWIGGLDRLHRVCRILTCYDFSATPFMPTGRKNNDAALFGWIVSDFGLTDAIESGLVKTPHVVIRDNALPNPKTQKSRFYHLYMDDSVHDDLNRKASSKKNKEAIEKEPLPDLVINAFDLLGADWMEVKKVWDAQNTPTPPVMIVVCNRTETAARVKHAFISKRVHVESLCDPDRIIHIDSSVLDECGNSRGQGTENSDQGLVVSGQKIEDSDQVAEDSDQGPVVSGHQTESNDNSNSSPFSQAKLTAKERVEQLRYMVNTIGTPEPGSINANEKPKISGAHIQVVISVGMLNEGWDAKTVTHIMGLRAFSSQLLCEQVVGRGLRRTSYEVNPQTGFFDPEYVNIFGVPFTFLPHEGGEAVPDQPMKPKTMIAPDPAKKAYQIQWPNVLRIDYNFFPILSLDWSHVQTLHLDVSQTVQIAELAPIIEGKPHSDKISSIDLEKLAGQFRYQRIIFETARDIFDQMKPTWIGNREILLAQLVRLTESFIRSDKIMIRPDIFNQDEMRRRLLITLNMSRVVQHIWQTIRHENAQRLTPILDTEHPIGSTSEMRMWYTSKPCDHTCKSHINLCPHDSAWETSDAFALDHHARVAAWAKNDHLGFEIPYIFDGVVHKYRPDFLVRLTNGNMLILETKGIETDQDRAKQNTLDEWTRAINSNGNFGHWHWAVASFPGKIHEILG